MTEINLIPTKLRTKDSLYKVIKAVKVLNLVGTALFFIIIFSLVFLIVYNQSLLSKAQKRQDQLKASITALNEVESQYILLKNRAIKAIDIYENESALKAVENYETVSRTTEGLLIDKVEISRSKNNLSLRALSASDLARFLDALLSLKLYQSISMDSFSFQPDVGYAVKLVFN